MSWKKNGKRSLSSLYIGIWLVNGATKPGVTLNRMGKMTVKSLDRTLTPQGGDPYYFMASFSALYLPDSAMVSFSHPIPNSV